MTTISAAGSLAPLVTPGQTGGTDATKAAQVKLAADQVAEATATALSNQAAAQLAADEKAKADQTTLQLAQAEATQAATAAQTATAQTAADEKALDITA